MPFALLLALFLTDVPSSRRAVECRADEDCVVSTFQGCCGGCCPERPRAVSRARDEQDRMVCGIMDCGPPSCAEVRCVAVESAASFTAVCRANQCQLVRRPAAPPAPECRADDDCVAVTQAPPPNAACHQLQCGCCPITTVVPRARAVEPPPPPGRRPAPPPANDGAPPFGLTSGQSPAPACAPCPSPPRVRPSCQAGRCLSAPIRLPHPG